MRARVILRGDSGTSDEAVRLLFLFGYWAQFGRPLPDAAWYDIAVVSWQSDGVVVAAPTDVVLATLLLFIEWRNHPVIAWHARLLSQLELQASELSPRRPLPRLQHPFFTGMPQVYARGLATLPQVIGMTLEAEPDHPDR